ncbi:2OG-Fe(II) oxygenase [Myxosarcina sp. GI1]|uniref:2OG-Fe(II) oxygenase n=1 Tax=Myxosarcina sp. GI1 TaxID=1541065 RepID=UPI000690EB47|nr:2OG-Fe(II) oxygenase [Myxosarcina sp. GI1]
MQLDLSALDNKNEIFNLKPFSQALELLRNRSKIWQQSYITAKPYPHLAIDNLFEPELLERLLAEFPQPEHRDWLVWNSTHESKTTSRGIDKLPIFTQMFCLWLNSREVIKAIEPIVGIDNLVGDPMFHGAGLHEMYRDGWLEMHADYTKHSSLPLMRRVNLLIYLNQDWDTSWGGELTLQDYENSNHRVSYAPYFNRTIIFPTTTKTFHGVPTPLTCPLERSRKLLSIYYWTPIAMPRLLKGGTSIRWATQQKRNSNKMLFRARLKRLAKRNFN